MTEGLCGTGAPSHTTSILSMDWEKNHLRHMERIGAGKCGMHRRSNEVVYICKIERHAIHLCSFLTNAVKEWLLLGQGQNPPTHTDSAGGGGGFWRADFGVCIHFRAPPGFSTLGNEPNHLPSPEGVGGEQPIPRGTLRKTLTAHRCVQDMHVGVLLLPKAVDAADRLKDGGKALTHFCQSPRL